MIQFLRQLRLSLLISLYRCAAIPHDSPHYRHSTAFSPTLAARTDQNGSDIPQDLIIGPLDRKSSDLTLRFCVVILKCPAAEFSKFKKLKRKKTFKKIVTLKRHSTNITIILRNHPEVGIANFFSGPLIDNPLIFFLNPLNANPLIFRIVQSAKR
jgi:hypothetical protein